MGAALPGMLPAGAQKSAPMPVALHIYNVGVSSHMHYCNRVLRTLGTGAFHCGVEVHGREWSFEGRGIFRCPPRRCDGHAYVESLHLGKTGLSEHEVHELLLSLTKDWKGSDYDLLKHNCCHFCDELCKWLGVGAIPDWVLNLAGAGALVSDTHETLQTFCCARPISSPDGTAHAGDQDAWASLEQCLPSFEHCVPCVPRRAGTHRRGSGMQAMHVARGFSTAPGGPCAVAARCARASRPASPGGAPAAGPGITVGCLRSQRPGGPAGAAFDEEADATLLGALPEVVCEGCYGKVGRRVRAGPGPGGGGGDGGMLVLQPGTNWIRNDNGWEDSRQVCLDPYEVAAAFGGEAKGAPMGMPHAVAIRETVAASEVRHRPL